MSRRPRVLRRRAVVPVPWLTYDLSASELVGPYGSRPIYRLLGYFSLIGLLRVHVLLGDYSLALTVVEKVDLGGSAWGSKVRSVIDLG